MPEEVPRRTQPAKPGALAGRIPEFDGLRAISVLLVIICHAKADLSGTLPSWVFWFSDSLAHSGVVTFFVLSGFLITLLLQEGLGSGLPVFRPFLLRRVFRILPALYFYLLVIAILGFFGLYQVNFLSLLSSALFIWNYAVVMYPSLADGGFSVAHGWTLCVEMQFYLIWGFLASRLSRGNLVKAGLLMFVLIPVIRVVAYLLHPTTHGNTIGFHSRIDSLLVGSLLALSYHRADFQGAMRWLGSRRITRLGILLYVLIAHPLLTHFFLGRYLFTVGWAIECLMITSLVYYCMEGRSRFSSMLSSRPLRMLGLMSYSLYIWHMFFMDPVVWDRISWAGLPAMLIFSYLSYKMVERPFRAWGRKLSGKIWPAPFLSRTGRGAPS